MKLSLRSWLDISKLFRGGVVLNLVIGLIVTAPALPLLAIGTMVIIYVSPTPTPPPSARRPPDQARVAADQSEAVKPGAERPVSAVPEAAKSGVEAAPPASVPSGRAVIARGVLAGALGWLVLGVVAAFLGTVDRANRGVYRALVTRLDSLEIERKSAEQAQVASRATDADALARRTSFEEVDRHVEDLSRDLRERNTGQKSQ